MITYKLYKFNGEVVGACYETSLGTCFFGFKDLDNTDYQAYLKWVAEGNTPLPADEVN
jgi:hypothetical protein